MVLHILTYTDQRFGKPDYPSHSLHIAMVETSTLEQRFCTEPGVMVCLVVPFLKVVPFLPGPTQNSSHLYLYLMSSAGN